MKPVTRDRGGVSGCRDRLPQLGDELFLTDSGLETDLLFNGGFDLPDFASFVLLDNDTGLAALDAYFRSHVDLALDSGVGIVIETPTWRASSDWAARLGYDTSRLADVIRQAVDLLIAVRADRDVSAPPVVISGCLGPRGDGYSPGFRMSAHEAQDYHRPQVETFAATDIDLVSAMTITYADEAIGIARAATAAGLPSVISFTVETDGRLPDGSSVTSAISVVDDATGGGPSYYALNCAHPTHLGASLLDAGATGRLRGIRANASRMSHLELDNSQELDAGDPIEFGQLMNEIHQSVPDVTILGGCCGTDIRHIREIVASCL